MVKFFLMGLDGADPDLIKKFDMPNLKSIMKKGTHGKLRSTLPPVTAPAWSSIITGKDPSWHGVMHFVDTDPFFGKKQLVNSRSIKCKKIWQILNGHGLSCGIYTVPLTFPVEKINGFMVSGMLTPGNRSQIYPKMDINIKPFVNWGDARNLNIFYNEIMNNTEKKFRILKYLIKHHDIDFLFAVDSNTDSIQHLFFHQIGLDENRVKYVGRFFDFVDEQIGQILDMVDGPIMFVSDHGFGKFSKKWVYGNRWLSDQGLLTFNGNSVDWNKTNAYFYKAWQNCGFIKLNKLSNVNNIIYLLMEEEWVGDIYKSNVLFHGPFTKDMPEIIFLFEEDFTGNEKIGNFEVVEDIPEISRYTGHKIDGFWACSEKIHIRDITEVAPIILNLLGLENAKEELGSPIDHISERIIENLGRL